MVRRKKAGGRDEDESKEDNETKKMCLYPEQESVVNNLF